MKKFIAGVCLVGLLAGITFACPPVASQLPAYGYNTCAAASYSYQQAVYPVAVQLVVPYTPVVTVPAAAVQVQAQAVVPQAALPAPQQVPMPQAEAVAPMAAPVVVQRAVTAVYAAPVIAAYGTAGYAVGVQRAVVDYGYASRAVVVQRGAVVRQRVVVAAAPRRGILARIADRRAARRAGRGVPAFTTVY